MSEAEQHPPVSTLRRDFADLMLSAKTLTSDAVVEYLRDNLLPWIEGLLDDQEEQDEAIGDLAEEAQEVIHDDTATAIATVVAMGQAFYTELSKRSAIPPELAEMMKAWPAAAEVVKEILDNVTIPTEVEDPETKE